jgi:hypothetical protein
VSRAARARVLVAAAVALWLAAPPPAARAADATRPLTAEQKSWALATSAILFERNRDSHELLAGAPRTDWHVQRTRELLSEWWGIETRADLLDTLRWLERGGHRARFDRLGAAVDWLDWLDPRLVDRIGVPIFGHEVAVVRRHHKALGGKSILGWDYSRYVALCRWGYAAELLTEEEAWRCIMPAARALQRHFTSWSDLGENYLIGREFWSREQTRQSGDLYRATYQTLISYPASPWNRHPWGLELPG